MAGNSVWLAYRGEIGVITNPDNQKQIESTGKVSS
jgi:hypothetical protein